MTAQSSTEGQYGKLFGRELIKHQYSSARLPLVTVSDTYVTDNLIIILMTFPRIRYHFDHEWPYIIISKISRYKPLN